jgi:hypothetical protein
MDAVPLGTPQLKKLGLAPGVRWALVAAPRDWAFEVAPDPADAAASGEPAEVIIFFARTAAEVAPALAQLEPLIFPAGALWIAWPRKAAGHVTDLSDTAIRELALARSLVDTKVAAIDHDWSGLKLVWRVSARS